jgi:hypothetical protein
LRQGEPSLLARFILANGNANQRAGMEDQKAKKSLSQLTEQDVLFTMGHSKEFDMSYFTGTYR